MSEQIGNKPYGSEHFDPSSENYPKREQPADFWRVYWGGVKTEEMRTTTEEQGQSSQETEESVLKKALGVVRRAFSNN